MIRSGHDSTLDMNRVFSCVLCSYLSVAADDIKRVDCMRRQTVIFLIIALLVSFCINIALTVVCK